MRTGMKIGMILTRSEPETVFNLFRFANFSLRQGDQVRLFLLGQGVDFAQNSAEPFLIPPLAEEFLAVGGVIQACGSCLKLRERDDSALCPLSTLADLHTLVHEMDRVLTF